MYKLLRRISGSIFPRPDRPWDEDATSTAPQIGKRRRMSDDDEEPSTPSLKKSKTALLPNGVEAIVEEGPSPAENDESAEDVKEVTKGVRDVEIDDAKKAVDVDEVPAAEEAAAVPLPESPIMQATATEEAHEPSEPTAVDEEKESEEKAVEIGAIETEASVEGQKVAEESAEKADIVEDSEEKAGAVEEKVTTPIAAATHDAEAAPAVTQDATEEHVEPTDKAVGVATTTELTA